MDGKPEFQRITVIAEHECFLWAVDPGSGEERLVGIDFDVLGIDVPRRLVEQFLQLHREWEEAHKFVFDPTCERPPEERFQEFHADGRVLAEELSPAIGQPVEYRS